MSNIKISIITVCYNSDKTIQNTIESVVNQSYKSIEYIVINGGSGDRTFEMISNFKKQGAFSHVVSEPDKGVYDAMNKGINLATGEVIGFLNADDVFYDSQVLEHIASSFDDDVIDGVYGDLVYVRQNDLQQVVRNWISTEYQSGLFKTGWHPAHPTLYMRKSVYKKNGEFNLKYKIAADYELMLRMIHKHKINVKYLPKYMVRMRMGGVSNRSIKNILLSNYECMQAWKDNGLPIPYIGLIKKPISKLLQF